MNQISMLTKQDIFSVLKNGIEMLPAQNKTDDLSVINLNMFGKMDEIDFLSRLYNLEQMPSYDNRFPNFKGDIIQHRYNNFDWDDYWFFDDDRLKLWNDDEHFLNFIKEIFNPYVREEKSNWLLFLNNINDLLRKDGYELYEKDKISGRSIYDWKKIDSIQKKNGKKLDLNMIGTGSYANVYSYYDDDYSKKVVLKRAKKELTNEEIERFKREFIEMKNLNSPYIVEVYSYHNENNEYTMEYLDYTLDKFIQINNNKLTIKDRANLVFQLLKAINYIYSKGKLHRDLSYTNILIKEYDNIHVLKISDFGLVKIIDSNLTRTYESIKGSLHDPNLEVVGYKNYKLSHEIYSIMFIIHYIMTGKKDISECKDEKLKIFLLKGIDPIMENRYKSIEEIRQAFNKYINDKY